MAQLADATTSAASGSETSRGSWGYAGATAAGMPEGLMWRDDSDGRTAPPCQRQERRGVIGGILWPVEAGARTLTIWVRHPIWTSPPPRIVAKANPAVGLFADLVAEATQNNPDWHQLTLSFTATAVGIVEVVREVRSMHQGAYAKWDDLP